MPSDDYYGYRGAYYSGVEGFLPIIGLIFYKYDKCNNNHQLQQKCALLQAELKSVSKPLLSTGFEELLNSGLDAACYGRDAILDSPQRTTDLAENRAQ